MQDAQKTRKWYKYSIYQIKHETNAAKWIFLNWTESLEAIIKAPVHV